MQVEGPKRHITRLALHVQYLKWDETNHINVWASVARFVPVYVWFVPVTQREFVSKIDSACGMRRLGWICQSRRSLPTDHEACVEK
jgi:hypothetical protein